MRPFRLLLLECLRLNYADKQQEMFKMIMGAYPQPMGEVMTDDTPGESKSVLDLGCGSGSWSECFSSSRRRPDCPHNVPG
jgi:predicted TPR repeat methyltransferase